MTHSFIHIFFEKVKVYGMNYGKGISAGCLEVGEGFGHMEIGKKNFPSEKGHCEENPIAGNTEKGQGH